MPETFDIIIEKVLPFLEGEGYHDIGIIPPHHGRLKAAATQLGSEYEVATVPEFQS